VFLKLMLLLACFALTCLASPAYADKVQNDLQAWQSVAITLQPIPNKPKIKLYGQLETRQLAMLSRYGQSRLRGAVGYEILPNTEVWVGYVAAHTHQPQSTNEHRIYQQINTSKNVLGGDLALRTRLEQRFFSDSAPAAWRGRARLSYARPFKQEGTWYWVASNEAFVHFDATPSIDTGFTQNRLFVGVGRPINDHMRMEGGYLAVLERNRSGDDELGHALYLGVSFNGLPGFDE
jgi:hypothetical protein